MYKLIPCYPQNFQINMTKGMTVAYACAKKVAERLPENKRKSYRQRLTSSLALKDYSAFLDILAQLSNSTDIQFDFVYSSFFYQQI